MSGQAYPPTLQAFTSASNLSINNLNFTLVGGDLIPATKETGAEVLGQIAEWLGHLNFRVIHHDALAKRTPGTGAWLISGKEFEEWLSKDGAALWVTGMPGAGKSVLCAIVIDYLETQLCHSSSDSTIIFAFCRYTDHHTTRDIFASLVKQLLERHPSVLKVLIPVFQKHNRERTHLSKEDLVDLLQKLVTHFRRVFVAVDGLDEVSDDTKLELLRGLASLPSQANLFLSSRSLESFTHLVPRRICISITEQNQADIDVFIGTKIAETPRFSELFRGKDSLKQEVSEQIKAKSNGMFLVAALQIEALKRCTTVKKLRLALNALPVGVHAMYKATWVRIEAQSAEESLLAKRAILWVAYAVHSLGMAELQEALAICGDGDLESEEFDEEDKPPENLVLAVCCGLLTVEGEQAGVVRLVHYTALDFVQTLSEDIFSAPHTFLGTSCIIYLHASDFPGVTESLSMDAFGELVDSKPLVGYAYRNWGIHARKACDRERGLPKLLREFFLGFTRFPWPDGERASRSDILSPVHVAAHYGLEDLFDHCIREQPTAVDCRTRLRKMTPLMFAAREGHAALVQTLRNRPNGEVAINAQNWWGYTALILASWQGHERVVYDLLYPFRNSAHETTNMIDVHLETYRNPTTALISAARGGHESIVKMLLHYDPTINLGAEDANGDTALCTACQEGNVGVVRALLSSPVAHDVNRKNASGGSPLYFALTNNHIAIVKLLLDYGQVKINKRFEREMPMTPFLMTCLKGDETLARMFLEYSKKQKGDMVLDLGAQGWNGSTALANAASKGHSNIVSLLLPYTVDGGVDLNARDDNGDTALFVTSQQGFEEIVRLLLGRTIAGGYKEDQVDIHAANLAGETPILAAKRHGHEAIVDILRAHGADENIVNLPPKLNPYITLELFMARYHN